MKKLTAGIFATILGVTAMGAADAAVTSKGYVDAAVGAVAGDVSTLSSTVSGHTTDIANLQTADTTLQGNINTLAQNTTNSLNLKADKAEVGTLPAGTSATTVVEYVDLKTKDIASSDTVTGLTTRVEAIEGDYITSQKLTESQNAQNLTITAAYEADDATTLQAAKDYADAAKSAAIAAAASDATKYIDETELVGKGYATKTEAQDYADAAESAAIAAAALDAAKYIDETELAGKGYLTSTSLTDYATKAEAKGYADAKDAAISAAQTAADNAAAAASTADGKAVAAQGTADNALTKAEANEIAITNLEAFDNSIKTATENAADGTYALTMKKNAQTGVMEFGWELIQRDGTLN